MEPLKPRISVKYAEIATILAFTDEKILEENDVRSVQESIMSVIEETGSGNIVLDFCNVHFLSSAVLGLLIRVSKKIYEQGGQLRLCSIDSKIYEIFKITRLIEIFDICENAEEAVKSLPGSG
ncbi:MAG: STAS domain-containing protein [Planctomycetota bacterium]|jgi:anti-sigma B factor antagonist